MKTTSLPSFIPFGVAIGILSIAWSSTALASYGGTPSTPTPTPSATPSVISVSSSSGGGGGGGGGGGRGSFGAVASALSSCSSKILSVEPAKNTTVSQLENITLTTNQDIAIESLSLSVNGTYVPTAITLVPNTGFTVEALNIDPKILKEGKNFIALSAKGRGSGSCSVTSSYWIDIQDIQDTKSIEPSSVPTPHSEKSVSFIPTPQTPPAPLSVYNACQKGEVLGDGSHNPSKTYSDTSGHWSESYILDLTKRCIVHGRKGEKFEPEASFNRAEAAKVLIKTFNSYPTQVSQSPFSDVETGSWYAPYVVAAKNAGFISGYGDGSYGPSKPLSRVEALAMVARAKGIDTSVYDTSVLEGYNDVESSSWYAPYVSWAIQKGMLSAESGNFNPGSPVSRGEYAAILSLGIR